MTIQERIQTILNKFGQDSVSELKRQHVDAGQKATGNALRSFAYDVVVEGYDVALKIKGASYSEQLDKGRGPTQNSGSGQLVEAIKAWIDAKGVFGVLEEKKKTSLAWAISKTIHEKGTYQYRTGHTYNGATNPISSVFEKVRMEQLINEITFAVIPVVTSDIINQYKQK